MGPRILRNPLLQTARPVTCWRQQLGPLLRGESSGAGQTKADGPRPALETGEGRLDLLLCGRLQSGGPREHRRRTLLHQADGGGRQLPSLGPRPAHQLHPPGGRHRGGGGGAAGRPPLRRRLGGRQCGDSRLHRRPWEGGARPGKAHQRVAHRGDARYVEGEVVGVLW